MSGGTIREGSREDAPGTPVLTNTDVLKKMPAPSARKPEEFPKTPYDLVAGQDPARRRVMREHGING